MYLTQAFSSVNLIISKFPKNHTFFHFSQLSWLVVSLIKEPKSPLSSHLSAFPGTYTVFQQNVFISAVFLHFKLETQEHYHVYHLILSPISFVEKNHV